MPDPELRAFTIKFNNVSRELKTGIRISKPYRPDSKEPEPELFDVEAIWDTGATMSVITEEVVQRLGLKRIDEAAQSTANGNRKAGEYLLNF